MCNGGQPLADTSRGVLATHASARGFEPPWVALVSRAGGQEFEHNIPPLLFFVPTRVSTFDK